jgi:dTDP-4-amino-4,6-dideoxygalactose transaminase
MSSPDITDAEREAVASVLRTPNLSMGGEIQAFEAAFRDFTGSKHAIGVSSGTAGLHLCTHAAGISDGDLVITTPFSFVASANVILFERATPIFIDVDPITGNIDVEKVHQAVEDLKHGGKAAERWIPRAGVDKVSQLKAILIVDVFGQPADLDPIMEIAADNGLKVIEDSCEALGAEYKGRKAGTIGDYGVFAFYPNKQITTGEGAVIITEDVEAAKLMLSLRNQGRSPGDTWLQHTHLGYNYRLDEMSAALGRIQVGRLNELINKRQQVAEWYHQYLLDLPGVAVPVVVPNTTHMSWFVYVIRLHLKINRDKVAQGLKATGIPARPYFIPIHLQPYMVERFGYKKGDFPVTEDLGRRGLALPFSSVMTEVQVKRVCQTIRELIQ